MTNDYERQGHQVPSARSVQGASEAPRAKVKPRGAPDRPVITPESSNFRLAVKRLEDDNGDLGSCIGTLRQLKVRRLSSLSECCSLGPTGLVKWSQGPGTEPSIDWAANNCCEIRTGRLT